MRILEIALGAVDIAELRRFYCGILGLREYGPSRSDRLVVEAGSSRLTFVAPQTLDPTAPPNWHGRYHLAFDVPNGRFDAAYDWLRERRSPLANSEGETRFHSQDWDSDSVYFLDPQGNILELIARYEVGDPVELDECDGQPFDANEVLSISEIGLAVQDMADATAQLMNEMPGLRPYKTVSEEFRPLGDGYGLLIVVHRGRVWFPNTGVPADPLPLTLELELENGPTRYRLQVPPHPFEISAI